MNLKLNTNSTAPKNTIIRVPNKPKISLYIIKVDKIKYTPARAMFKAPINLILRLSEKRFNMPIISVKTPKI